MHMYSFGNEDLSDTINYAFDALLTSLRDEGVITEEQLEQMLPYRVVCHTKHRFWGSLWNTIWKKKDAKIDSDNLKIKIVKILDKIK